MPIYLVIEDVGWWQGIDGSAYGEPYRNKFSRRHCLEDYRALTYLARRLSMRISLGMVLAEWDRTDFLKDVVGTTWQGKSWNNRINRGPWLEETSDYLNGNSKHLEIALHGVAHEYWDNGEMKRTEFHDSNSTMRPPEIVVSHLEAFFELLHQNGIESSPRLFIPPALKHSFGDGKMQPLLQQFGISAVTTSFEKAYQHTKPIHPMITWESGVVLLERGLAPVSWDTVAALPSWNGSSPIIALHWTNLLHPRPEQNIEVVEKWADMLLREAESIDVILAKDLGSCWRQAAVHYLAKIEGAANHVTIDLTKLPPYPFINGSFVLTLQGPYKDDWHCKGASIKRAQPQPDNITRLEISPEKGEKTLSLFL